jgi:hypothetical protein
MSRRAYSADERAAVNAARALLAAAAKELEQARPADIERAAAILGKYSRRNIALILVQAGERGRDIPAAVAGFHEWRAAGRMVRKGAKGYAIFAPIVRKAAADVVSDGDDGPRGFTVRYVFDVADTDALTDSSPATLRELETAVTA